MSPLLSHSIRQSHSSTLWYAMMYSAVPFQPSVQSKESSVQFSTMQWSMFTEPPKNSMPSSEPSTTWMYEISVPLPTP